MKIFDLIIQKMTKEKHELKAQLRNLLGRKKVKKIRKEGLIPSTIYSKGAESISIQFNFKEFSKIFAEAGESGLVELSLDNKKYPVLFKNPQYDPMDGFCLHIDCHKVNLKEKIKAAIVIELIGESEAIKAGNILVSVTNEVEVEALPNDLPESFEVDISMLTETDQMITVADLTIDKTKVEMLTPNDTVIAKAEAPRIEEEIDEETINPEDVPATKEKVDPEKKEEGKEEKSNENRKEA
jgi:large subunit ribosomal protein L25